MEDSKLTRDEARSIDLPFTTDLRYILGRQGFSCTIYVPVLRILGYEIAERTEDEQAATIHWMLQHYLKDPANWRHNLRVEFESTANRMGRPGTD